MKNISKLDLEILKLKHLLNYEIDPEYSWLKSAKCKKFNDILSDQREIEKQLRQRLLIKFIIKIKILEKRQKKTFRKLKSFYVQKLIRKLKTHPLPETANDLSNLNAANIDKIYLNEFVNVLVSKNTPFHDKSDLMIQIGAVYGTYLEAPSEIITFLSSRSIQDWKQTLLTELIEIYENLFLFRVAQNENQIKELKNHDRTQFKEHIKKSSQLNHNHQLKRGKNRLGQKARRMMWEKLHGTEANHLKKIHMPDKKNSRTNDSTALHPSWEAKKLQRQTESNKIFSGQKISFDD